MKLSFLDLGCCVVAVALQMTESGDVFSQLVQPVAAAESERCSGRSSPAHMDEVFFNSQRRRQQRGGHASTAGAGDDHDSDGSSSDRSSTEDGADSSVRDLLARTLDASCQEDCRSWLLHAKAHHRVSVLPDSVQHSVHVLVTTKASCMGKKK